MSVGQHDHDEAGVHDAVLRGGLLGLHQVQETDRQRPRAVRAAEQREGDDVLVQKERKLKRIIVEMEGWAMGKIIFTIVVL